MAQKKPRLVVTRKLPDIIETRMMELFDTRLNLDDHPMSADELISAVSDAEVLVPTVTDRIDGEIIAACGADLKLIANFGNGVDHIDLAAAKEKGLSVTNTPDVLTEDTADMTMGLIVMTSRSLSGGERILRQGDWEGWSPTSFLGSRVNGKRLGIIGMGRIGQALAKRAQGFGLAIHYHNRHRVHPDLEGELDATYWESLDQMIAHMDIISVNCPHTPATYHLLSARRLKLIPPTCFIVNTARGSVIDETALVGLLVDGAIAGAGLDVYENEPSINPKLVDMDNVVLLPHLGSATLEGRISMGEKVVINVKSFVDGHPPPDRVLETLL
ncbi:MAG: D-glycerate dehydrogenase [Rhodospirillales bacterium]|nr:D-glycerate dehydrogenase [Rhodospirillales bacterium]